MDPNPNPQWPMAHTMAHTKYLPASRHRHGRRF
jgi:hypothetical protein